MFCWFFRLAISHTTDADKPLSAATKRHADRCPDCREFYHLCRSLAEDLRREVAAFSRDTPAKLSERIMRNVAGTETQTSNIRILLRPIAVAACIALIALASVFVSVQRRHIQHKNEIAKTVATFRNLVGRDLSPELAELVEKPLAGELQNIVRDTESAARFLWTCVAVDVTFTEAKSTN